MRILVTGANGFVGAKLCTVLPRPGSVVRAGCRRGGTVPAGAQEVARIGDAGPEADWTAALAGVDAVVHLAARVHVMREESRDPLAEFRRVNVAGTRRLAECAVQAGVRRFVYVSSIKVNGERTGSRPFTETDPPCPEDAYAQSKYEAEMALREIAARTGMEIVIVRPPLVYGPGVKGNFLALLRVVQMGLPLPLASCNNRRSLVGLSNIADLLALCVTHPAAAGETFLAADGEELSTPELLRRAGRALGRPARLFPVPPALLRAGARMLGRAGAGERLCGSLQIDISRTRRILGWNPPSSVDEELARTAQWYQQHCAGGAKR